MFQHSEYWLFEFNFQLSNSLVNFLFKQAQISGISIHDTCYLLKLCLM